MRCGRRVKISHEGVAGVLRTACVSQDDALKLLYPQSALPVAREAGLKGLGLGPYEGIFREHEIDSDVLPDLTEADLERIGLPLGARKRLMKGISAWGGFAGRACGSRGLP